MNLSHANTGNTNYKCTYIKYIIVLPLDLSNAIIKYLNIEFRWIVL